MWYAKAGITERMNGGGGHGVRDHDQSEALAMSGGISAAFATLDHGSGTSGGLADYIAENGIITMRTLILCCCA